MGSTPFSSGPALHPGRQAWIWVAAGSAGIVAGAATIAAVGNVKYLAALLILWMVAVVFLVSGNLRLASLYSILLLAPLRLGKAFFIIPHMGGASGFWIDGIDPLMLLLLAYQVRDRMQGRRDEFRFPRSAALWTGLTLLGLVGVIMAPFRMMAAHEMVRMLKLLLLVLVIVNEVVRHKQFMQATVALMAGVFVNSALAIAQWITGKHFGLEFLGEADRRALDAIGAATLLSGEFVYRPGGLMGAGNLFAAYLALLLPVAIALLLVPLGRAFKFFLVVTVVLGQAGLVLTLSRSGWIAFAVAFLSVLVLGMWNPVSRRRYFVARVAIVATTVVVSLAFTPLIIQRITQSEPGAFKIRLEWLRTARAMVLDKPLLGVGLNKYVYVQMPYGEDKTADEMNARYGDLWPVVHSTWAVTWAEQGTLGFLLFVGLHVSVIRVGLGNLRIRDPMMHALSVGLLSGFFAIMIDGLSSFFLRMDQHARVFWIVTALIVAVGYWRHANEAKAVPVRPRRTAKGGAPGGWLPRPSGHGTLGGPAGPPPPARSHGAGHLMR